MTEDPNPTITEIEQRVEELSEQNENLQSRLSEVEQAVSVEDADGRTVSLPQLREFGLTRRQALQAIGLLAAGGVTLAGAVQQVTAASTSSGMFAAEVIQAREVHDRNNNVVFNFNGSGGVQSISTDELSITEGGAKIYATADQTISSGTITTVAFDTKDSAYNSGDVLTVDLTNNKITIEKSGRYVIKGNVNYRSPDDGTRIKNIINARQNAGMDNTAGANDRTGAVVALTERITSPPTDLTLQTFQNSGSGKNTVGAEADTYLSIGRIG